VDPGPFKSAPRRKGILGNAAGWRSAPEDVASNPKWFAKKEQDHPNPGGRGAYRTYSQLPVALFTRCPPFVGTWSMRWTSPSIPFHRPGEEVPTPARRLRKNGSNPAWIKDQKKSC